MSFKGYADLYIGCFLRVLEIFISNKTRINQYKTCGYMFTEAVFNESIYVDIQQIGSCWLIVID